MLLAQVLPLALFLLGLEWVVGSFAILMIPDFEGEISGAFLGRFGLIFLVGALITAWLRSQYPSATALEPLGVRPEWLVREQRAYLAFVVLLALYNPMVWFSLRRLRRVVGLLATLAGAATIICSGFAYGRGYWAGAGTAGSFLLAALVLGAATTGLAVGHSYLSETKLTARLMRHLTTILIVAVLSQLLLLPIYLGLLGGEASTQGQALLDGYWLIFGVRVAIGLIVPLVLAVLAWHTSRIQAMRSATGLLYIGTGILITGEIAAKVLFFVSGIPV